jgi:hypothetical protein
MGILIAFLASSGEFLEAMLQMVAKKIEKWIVKPMYLATNSKM